MRHRCELLDPCVCRVVRDAHLTGELHLGPIAGSALLYNLQIRPDARADIENISRKYLAANVRSVFEADAHGDHRPRLTEAFGENITTTPHANARRQRAREGRPSIEDSAPLAGLRF